MRRASACALACLLCLGLAAPALAAPALQLTPLSDTTAAPGDADPATVEHTFLLGVHNAGDAPTDTSVAPVEVHVELPDALGTVVAREANPGNGFPWICPDATLAAHAFTCSYTGEPIVPFRIRSSLGIDVSIDPGATGIETARFTVSGGGSAPMRTADPVRVSLSPPPFGIDAFDARALAGPTGPAFTQAGGHPYSFSADFDFNTTTDPEPVKGEAWPIEPLRDVVVSAPPGLIGQVGALARCTAEQLAFSHLTDSITRCPPASQVGTTTARFNALYRFSFGPIPIYNMAPSADEPARFGFNILGVPIFLHARVRSESDFGVDLVVDRIPEAVGLAGIGVDFWGDPGSAVHDPERACPGSPPPSYGDPSCPAGPDQPVFLRMPTACTGPGHGLPFLFRADSWADPGAFEEANVLTHEGPGYPNPRGEWGEEAGTEGCDSVPFTPGISIQPTSAAADSPSGLAVEITVPQDCWGDADAICQSDLRDGDGTFLRDLTVNPAAATGLTACAPAQIALHTNGPARCPDSSRIGDVTVDTPVLDHLLAGSVYLATQGDNPFGSLLAIYVVAEGSGVFVKQPGRVLITESGALMASFRDIPQAPIADLRFTLDGGDRGALRTPPRCGEYSTDAYLTPWSGGGGADLSSAFRIDSGPGGGLCPDGALRATLRAGTVRPRAGAFSPFVFDLSREDGSGELTGLEASLPAGLVARLAGIPPCPAATLEAIPAGPGTGTAELASPACPAASRVGRIAVDSGAGPAPFHLDTGRVYLAGPHAGAPLSLAVVTPAIAGPFDLGNVVVRVALRIDPATGRITAVPDALPAVVQSIPIDLRRLHVEVDRPRFALNPTSCDPLTVDAAVRGSGGDAALLSDRFQVGGCGRLGFGPRVSLRLEGGTGRTAHPAVIATVRAPDGEANVTRAQVTLPRVAFLDNAQIGAVCTRPQFAAGQCPLASVYGRAEAKSPLLDHVLRGPVYLRSNPDRPLPDLVVALRGPDAQPIELHLAGRTGAARGALRSTFESVPDAPVSRFRLELFGGRRGLVELSRDICAHRYRATVLLDAHNGRTHDTRPLLRAPCPSPDEDRG